MKRALLIGSQTGKLTGVYGDVERMHEALAQRGFDSTLRVKEQASRDGILAAYRELIDATVSDDTVCIYYSGHGNYAENPQYETDPSRGPQFLQYIVPTDEGEDFRGVLSFELSRLLARLTEKSRNVTVILDCCHSARMSRAANNRNLTPKGGSMARKLEVAEWLAKTSTDAGPVYAESNPHAVRLVATEAETSAFEYTNAKGLRTSVFTEMLLTALEEAQAEPTSWAALMQRVRELVMAAVPDQRPSVEGPRDHGLWTLEVLPDERPLALYYRDDAPELRGGSLFGALPGAVYGVMPPHSVSYVESRAICQAVVEQTLGSRAKLRFEGLTQATRPEPGSLAFPLAVPFRKCPVVLAPGVPVALAALVRDSSYLEAIPDRPNGLVTRVTLEGDSLELRDPLAELLSRVGVAEPGSVDRIFQRLELLARAEDLRGLEPGGLNASVAVEFGLVENGKRVPLGESASIYEGDLIYVAVKNEGFADVYVAVFGIDSAYEIVLLSRRADQGQLLTPLGPELIIPTPPAGGLTGVEASWPESLPRDGSRRESFIVIVADAPQDFQLLTTAQARGSSTGSGSPLEARLRQARAGTARKRGEASATRSEYSFRRIDYEMHPGPRPAPRPPP